LTWERLPFVRAVERVIWHTPLDSAPAWRAVVLRLTRLTLALGRDLVSGQLTLRAMSLVYTTLLSIVPLLALSFSVLKAFGVHNQIEPTLRNFLAPLGPQGDEVTAHIIEFVERMNVGVLGSLGFALLLYTAISLVQKIEESFNFIWHIAESRSLSERFSRYLSVLLVGPILLFSAVGLTAAVTHLDPVQGLLAMEPFGRFAYLAGRLTPYLLVMAAFTFIYAFVPNTRVRLWPAVAGGVVGGLLWQSGGWAFAAFVAASTRYSAIYSSFAILVLFMIWLHLSWLILLFGAAVAFYRQHPEYVLPQSGEPRLSNRMRERLALVVVGLVAQQHRDGGPPWSLPRLSQRLGVPTHALRTVLGALQQAGILAQTGDDPPAYLPARDLARISLRQLLEAVRAAGEDRYLSPAALPAPPAVAAALERVDRALAASLDDLTAADLAGDLPQTLGGNSSSASLPAAAAATAVTGRTT
jgi:membrane protein